MCTLACPINATWTLTYCRRCHPVHPTSSHHVLNGGADPKVRSSTVHGRCASSSALITTPLRPPRDKHTAAQVPLGHDPDRPLCASGGRKPMSTPQTQCNMIFDALMLRPACTYSLNVVAPLEWQPHGRGSQRHRSSIEAAVVHILLSSLPLKSFLLSQCIARLAVLNCTSCPAREEAHMYSMHANSSNASRSYADASNQDTGLQVHAVEQQPGK
jgi:hypothetical protein